MRSTPSPTLPRKRGREKKINPLIEVLVQSRRWKAAPRAVTIVRKAISTAANVASTPQAELAIVLTNDSAIRALNDRWRKRDVPTNVLSFPAKRTSRPPPLRGKGGEKGERGENAPRQLGDIVIAFETTAREAAAEGKPFEHHLVHLAVHGFLHLLGYDHATDRNAKKMERLEVDILAHLGVPDPYVTRNPAV